MKIPIKTFLLFLLISSGIYSQQNPINRYVVPARALDYQACVDSIRVKSSYFKKNRMELDTINREYLAVFNNAKLTKRISYTENDSTPSQTIVYDSLGRITMLKRKNHYDKKFKIVQYFSNTSQYPDSTNFYFNNNKNESYRNSFRDSLVIRQEHYRRDTLRTYSVFKYDEADRLIEQIKVNTKNGYGIIIGKSITGTKDEKTLYPNDSITYEYHRAGDTLISQKYSNGELDEISKAVTQPGVKTEIKEEYSRLGYLSERTIARKYADSTNSTEYRFNEEKDTLSALKTHKESKIIVWDYSGQYSGSTSMRTSETENDNRGNWVIKRERLDGTLNSVIIREIIYCN